MNKQKILYHNTMTELGGRWIYMKQNLQPKQILLPMRIIPESGPPPAVRVLVQESIFPCCCCCKTDTLGNFSLEIPYSIDGKQFVQVILSTTTTGEMVFWPMLLEKSVWEKIEFRQQWGLVYLINLLRQKIAFHINMLSTQFCCYVMLDFSSCSFLFSVNMGTLFQQHFSMANIQLH